MIDYQHPDHIRTLFSKAMSDMYRNEVPQYGTLVDLVRKVNQDILVQNPEIAERFRALGEIDRLDLERHGAIRLGTAQELNLIGRIFAVMGMYPVGYYDLSVAGIPVHSTAFRPIDGAALQRNPFRVFTSLLRLDLVNDPKLVAEAQKVLAARQIVTSRALELLVQAEQNGGLGASDSAEFVSEVLEIFRWHSKATVSKEMYQKLHAAHRLIADVVSFSGPHINHLTPRTLDIDAVQQAMPAYGISPKAVIEGPPKRKADILLRQTSFKALEEPVTFCSQGGRALIGSHTARFGEIEQRGVALTKKGRALYDRLLDDTRAAARVGTKGEGAVDYELALQQKFTALPDDYNALRREGLAFFHYRPVLVKNLKLKATSIDKLIESGALVADPQTYEDFLPVSAAGIFQSNLGSDEQSNYTASSNKQVFEAALGKNIIDEMSLYESVERQSLASSLAALGQEHLL